jgi:Flp pilus assembly protein TadD
LKRLPSLVALIAAGLFAAGALAETAADAPHPLLALARQLESERGRDRDKNPGLARQGPSVAEATHMLDQAHAPKVGECAGTIGATRYAGLYQALGFAREDQGDFSGATAEYRKALDCRPHDSDILTRLASASFDARDFAGARAAIDAALALDPRSVTANRNAGNLDFIEERWADAIGRFRYVAASDADRVRASYGQLMYWLAQRRGGVAKPEWVTRTPGEGWPQPLLLYMRGKYTEAELLTPIRSGDEESNSQPDTNTDQRLCEALYYVGEEYWARGRPDLAREYFAAVVNIKIVAFIEHGMALAEITKLTR